MSEVTLWTSIPNPNLPAAPWQTMLQTLITALQEQQQLQGGSMQGQDEANTVFQVASLSLLPTIPKLTCWIHCTNPATLERTQQPLGLDAALR